MRDDGFDNTVAALLRGGVAVYPTETLYALGCAAGDAAACARVAAIKGRPEAKPFPLIVADMDGLAAIAEELPGDLLRLAERFWPGPLSVLVRTKACLPRNVRDAEGFSSVRISPHATARALCRALALAGSDVAPALVATSANKSGQPAAALPAELDADLAAGADAVLTAPPLPGGGQPSTLVRLLGDGHVRVLRAGAVPACALAEFFAVVPSSE
jgi:L-threonylcarbamoyladenylate synthase